jgi:hypothetical protein
MELARLPLACSSPTSQALLLFNVAEAFTAIGSWNRRQKNLLGALFQRRIVSHNASGGKWAQLLPL